MATIPSLALLPSGYKASKVYSVLPTDGTGDFDFTRSGNATRVNSDGLIETVGSNVPRLNYPLIDGVVNGCPSLLLEPSRTNLVQYSEDFSNAYWTKAGSSVVSGFTSPDGTANVFKLVEDTSTGTHKINHTSVTSNIYTISVFAKYNGRILQLASTSTGGHYANFDLLNGVIGNFGGTTENVTITEISNGWYRCSMTTTSNMNTAIINTVQSVTSVYQESYTGDGTSGVYIWGAQLEEGSYATSYIPTYGTSVTRNNDVCRKENATDIIGQTEGSFFMEFEMGINNTIGTPVCISEYASTSNFILVYQLQSNTLSFRIRDTSIDQFNITSDILSGGKHKFAFAYKENDCAFYIDGTLIGTNTSCTIPSNLNRLSLVDVGSGINKVDSAVNQTLLFKTRLSNEELIALTTI